MIDASLAMMLLGAAIQAVPPVQGLVTHMRRRPNAAEAARSPRFSPARGVTAHT